MCARGTILRKYKMFGWRPLVFLLLLFDRNGYELGGSISKENKINRWVVRENAYGIHPLF